MFSQTFRLKLIGAACVASSALMGGANGLKLKLRAMVPIAQYDDVTIYDGDQMDTRELEFSYVKLLNDEYYAGGVYDYWLGKPLSYPKDKEQAEGTAYRVYRDCLDQSLKGLHLQQGFDCRYVWWRSNWYREGGFPVPNVLPSGYSLCSIMGKLPEGPDIWGSIDEMYVDPNTHMWTYRLKDRSHLIDTPQNQMIATKGKSAVRSVAVRAKPKITRNPQITNLQITQAI